MLTCLPIIVIGIYSYIAFRYSSLFCLLWCFQLAISLPTKSSRWQCVCNIYFLRLFSNPRCVQIFFQLVQEWKCCSFKYFLPSLISLVKFSPSPTIDWSLNGQFSTHSNTLLKWSLECCCGIVTDLHP